jgi:hypothetical protein
VQTAEMRLDIDPSVTAHAKHAYMPMIETADHVADKYEVSREKQDEYSLKVNKELQQPRSRVFMLTKCFQQQQLSWLKIKKLVKFQRRK